MDRGLSSVCRFAASGCDTRPASRCICDAPLKSQNISLKEIMAPPSVENGREWGWFSCLFQLVSILAKRIWEYSRRWLGSRESPWLGSVLPAPDTP